jgi:hypothetical protein
MYSILSLSLLFDGYNTEDMPGYLLVPCHLCKKSMWVGSEDAWLDDDENIVCTACKK